MAAKYLFLYAVGLDESKLHEGVPRRGLDFDDWTSLISETEKKYPVSFSPKGFRGPLSCIL